MSEISEVLRKAALSLPGTDEGISCAGTKLERKTVTVRKHAFVFLGDDDCRLKLLKSVEEADALSVAVGNQGWASIKFATGPSREVLTRWVEESYRLFA